MEIPMRSLFLTVSCLLVPSLPAFAEVASVTIASRAAVAEGHAFGTTGSYEKLAGRIEYALDPAEPHNTRIVDLARAPRGVDGRVHFSSDLYVLRPTDPAKGNGVLLPEHRAGCARRAECSGWRERCQHRATALTGASTRRGEARRRQLREREARRFRFHHAHVVECAFSKQHGAVPIEVARR